MFHFPVYRYYCWAQVHRDDFFIRDIVSDGLSIGIYWLPDLWTDRRNVTLDVEIVLKKKTHSEYPRACSSLIKDVLDCRECNNMGCF